MKNNRSISRDFEGTTCLVTGGAGFIGSSLVESLVSLEADIIVIDNLSAGDGNVGLLDELSVDFYNEDITNYDSLSQIFEGVDMVFHLAAMNRAQRSIDNPLLSNSINVNGTLNCLHLSYLNNVKKFIFASSSSVYKGVQNKSLKEDMKLSPLHPYGVGKLAGEHYCRIYNDLFGLNTAVLRYFSVYGPRQRGDIDHAGVIAKFLLQAKKNADLTIYGDGKQMRNFSFVSDVVKGTILSALDSRVVGHVVNIASGDEISVLEIAEKIIHLTESTSNISYLDPLKGDPLRNKADVSKSRELLDFIPEFDIDTGLLETINR